MPGCLIITRSFFSCSSSHSVQLDDDRLTIDNRVLLYLDIQPGVVVVRRKERLHIYSRFNTYCISTVINKESIGN